MAKLPYDRQFTIGRQSEQFMNDELHIINESLKNINYRKNENRGAEPSSRVDGGLWLDKPEEALKYWDAKTFRWKSVFGNKFQIVDQLLNVYAPKAPVLGQLWLNSGVLMYFDGSKWQPVKTLVEDGTHWSGAAFEDFMIVSPLDPAKNTPTEKENDNNKYSVITNTIKIGFEEKDWHARNNEYYFDIEGEFCGINGVYEEGKDKNFTEVYCTVSILQNNIVEIVSPSPIKGFAIASISDSDKKISITADKDTKNTGYKDSHKNTNFVEPAQAKWGTDNWREPLTEKRVSENPISKDIKRQYIVPSTYTDRIFIGSSYDDSFKRMSSVCFEYPLDSVKNKILSAVHLNPGRLTKIEKRLIKIDSKISTIDIPTKDTEFYGFQSGKYTGDFLIESRSQEYGDYIPAGDHVVLNYNTVQNYDYILAIHYVFSLFNSSGTINKIDNTKKTFSLANVQDPINVHVNGLKLEEASYEIDKNNKVVILEDDISDLDVQIFTPLRKQFGYIRETDLEGNGYIVLQKKVSVPLVFVGGILIHPLYGGLRFEGNKIIIPNYTGTDSMKNLSWCVIDLVDGHGNVVNKSQGRLSTSYKYSLNNENYLDLDDNYHTHGSFQNEYDQYILSSGLLKQEKSFGKIYFDNKNIATEDGILVFVNGLMINDNDIVRHDQEGYLEILADIPEGSEYVVLKDVKKSLYNSANTVQAFATGYLDESIIYLNGKLLANEGCVATTDIPAIAQTKAINNEIKYFISENDPSEGIWKIYDGYNMKWLDINEYSLENIKLIVSSYSNQLSSVKINIKYGKHDDIKIFAYHYSGSLPGVLKYGEAYYHPIGDDNLHIYDLGKSAYQHDQKVLNVFCNGIKMVPNIDFKEIEKANSIEIVKNVKPEDVITYIIEPIENTNTIGHSTIILDEKDALQPNIYTIGEMNNAANLYEGRLTVYINGVRLPKENWLIIDSRKIMIKTPDYITVGSSDNYPESVFVKDKKKIFVTNNVADQIMIEIRKDFDRQEKTIEIDENTMEIYPEKYGIPLDILNTQDEILFYLNGQFCNMSRNGKKDYKIDKAKGCITIVNPGLNQVLKLDALKTLFNSRPLAYAAWKKQTGKDKYLPKTNNQLTLVWRG